MKNYDMDCYCNFFLSILHQRKYHPNCTKVCTCRVLGNVLHFMLRGSLKKPWVNMTRKHPPQVWSNYIPRKSSVKKHSPLIDGSIYMYINVTYNVQNTLNFQIPRKWNSPYQFIWNLNYFSSKYYLVTHQISASCWICFFHW